MKKNAYFGLCKRVTNIDVLKNAYCKFDFLTLNSQAQLAKSLVAKNLRVRAGTRRSLCPIFKICQDTNLGSPNYSEVIARMLFTRLRLVKNHWSNGCRNVNPSALLYSIGAQNPQQEVFVGLRTGLIFGLLPNMEVLLKLSFRRAFSILTLNTIHI